MFFWCFCYSQFICVSVSYFVFCVFPHCYCLVVSTSAINCLERLVSEMTCYMSSRMLNPTHSLIHPLCIHPLCAHPHRYVVFFLFDGFRTEVTILGISLKLLLTSVYFVIIKYCGVVWFYNCLVLTKIVVRFSFSQYC